ncbi:MAG TPA: hypothetical protein VI911_10715 [Patescibacteria group bacterium]|nr:hypothetical protein [Patescibacteria group bacterium]
MIDKEGKLPEGYWLDENEIKVIGKPKTKRANQDRGGFPSRIK